MRPQTRPRSRVPSWFAAALAISVAGLASLSACTNTTVFDLPDPLQCGEGNGCGIAVCECGDATYMIDSACESGKCVDPKRLCDDRCADYGGSMTVASSSGNTFGALGCEALDDRMLINGCKEGLELFATTCVPDATCASDSAAFWKCIIGEATLSCKKGALHATGCKMSPPLVLCTPAAK